MRQRKKKVLWLEMELGSKSRSGNVVAGVRTRFEKYCEDQGWSTNIKGKGGAQPLYDSPSPRW